MVGPADFSPVSSMGSQIKQSRLLGQYEVRTGGIRRIKCVIFLGQDVSMIQSCSGALVMGFHPLAKATTFCGCLDMINTPMEN